MSRRRLAAGLVLFASLSASLLVVPAAPAQAAPVANDDAYDVVAGGTYVLSPIDNDTSTLDLIHGEASFCGVRSFDRSRVYVEATEPDEGTDAAMLTVEVLPGFRGTTEITYAPCQGDQEPDTATITLDVVRLADVRAAKVRRSAGRVSFTNPNGATLAVTWGSASSGRPDATRLVPPRSTLTIRTPRRSLYWVAHYDHDGVIVTAGDGVLTGLQKPRAGTTRTHGRPEVLP